MATLKNWNGEDIAVRRSRRGVLTLERWQDNVLRMPDAEWPSELLEQVRAYRAQPEHFHSDDAEVLQADLGLISRFQSINSEDAVTWSWFGTLGTAPATARQESIGWLYDRIGLGVEAVEPQIDQWMRIYHPNAPGSSRGPELDARIVDTTAVVYVEAKWHATLGTGRGADAGIPADQIELRRDSLLNDPGLANDGRAHAVLLITETGRNDTEPSAATGPEKVPIASLTWAELAECPTHPLADEFKRYLAWKREHALTRAPI